MEETAYERRQRLQKLKEQEQKNEYKETNHIKNKVAVEEEPSDSENENSTAEDSFQHEFNNNDIEPEIYDSDKPVEFDTIEKMAARVRSKAANVYNVEQPTSRSVDWDLKEDIADKLAELDNLTHAAINSKLHQTSERNPEQNPE